MSQPTDGGPVRMMADAVGHLLMAGGLAFCSVVFWPLEVAERLGEMRAEKLRMRRYYRKHGRWPGGE